VRDLQHIQAQTGVPSGAALIEGWEAWMKGRSGICLNRLAGNVLTASGFQHCGCRTEPPLADGVWYSERAVLFAVRARKGGAVSRCVHETRSAGLN